MSRLAWHTCTTSQQANRSGGAQSYFNAGVAGCRQRRAATFSQDIERRAACLRQLSFLLNVYTIIRSWVSYDDPNLTNCSHCACVVSRDLFLVGPANIRDSIRIRIGRFRFDSIRKWRTDSKFSNRPHLPSYHKLFSLFNKNFNRCAVVIEIYFMFMILAQRDYVTFD